MLGWEWESWVDFQSGVFCALKAEKAQLAGSADPRGRGAGEVGAQEWLVISLARMEFPLVSGADMH